MSDQEKDWSRLKEEFEQAELNDEQQESNEEHKGLEHPDYETLEAKLTEAEQKAHENYEKAVRAMAELDNVRRRAERDIEKAHRYSVEKLLDALIPVVDSLEQALTLSQDTAMQEGLNLTMKLFMDVLEKFGVKQINPEGELFDPQSHEAMTAQISDEHPANTVLAVFQKGYKLHDRVIRPARVVVSKTNG